MIRLFGWGFVALAVVLQLVAIGGYATAIRGAYYDAIAASTLFDARWIIASVLLGANLVLALHWPWYVAGIVGLAGFLTALPVKALIRLVAGRR